MLKTFLALMLALSAVSAQAEEQEFNPFDPNAELMLEEFDAAYEAETGESPWMESENDLLWNAATGGCYRASCQVFIDVNKSARPQTLSLYLNGSFQGSWAVSSGRAPFGTPNFDKHPDGRIYTRYSSRKFPGGDYNGLGNMPYAIFIRGGFALHGTPTSNWRYLGQPASHGCIRMHPDNAARLNALVRQAGVRNTWITVR